MNRVRYMPFLFFAHVCLGAGNIQVFSVTPQIKLVIQQGDITHCSVDAIVNAANEQLLGGGGVCGAIFNAAGWDELQKACHRVPRVYPGINDVRCPVGEARISKSFKLADRGIRWIIHAVGPDCRVIKDENEQNDRLTKTYQSSLQCALELKDIHSIAFPFISSAIYAFPPKRAARIAIEATITYLKNHQSDLKEVHFVLFSQDDYKLFCDTVEQVL